MLRSLFFVVQSFSGHGVSGHGVLVLSFVLVFFSLCVWVLLLLPLLSMLIGVGGVVGLNGRFLEHMESGLLGVCTKLQ